MSNLTEIFGDASALITQEKTAKNQIKSGEDFASLLASEFAAPNFQPNQNAVSFPKTDSSSFALHRDTTPRSEKNDVDPQHSPKNKSDDIASSSQEPVRNAPEARDADRGAQTDAPPREKPVTDREPSQKTDNTVASNSAGEASDDAQTTATEEGSGENSTDTQTHVASKTTIDQVNVALDSIAKATVKTDGAAQDQTPQDTAEEVGIDSPEIVAQQTQTQDPNAKSGSQATQHNPEVAARTEGASKPQTQQTSDEIKISVEKGAKEGERFIDPENSEGEQTNQDGQNDPNAESSSPFAHLTKKSGENKSDNTQFPQLQTATNSGQAPQQPLTQTPFGALAANTPQAANSNQVTRSAPVEIATADGTAVIGSNGSIQSKNSTATMANAAARTNLPGQTAAEQVGVQVNKAMLEGKDKITIQLKPVELGQVEIKLEMNHDGRMTAVVSAERQETLDLLRGDQRNLLQSMNEAGMKLDQSNLSFNLGSQNDGKDQGKGSQGGNRGGNFDLDASDSEDAPMVAEGEEVEINEDGRLNVRV